MEPLRFLSSRMYAETYWLSAGRRNTGVNVCDVLFSVTVRLLFPKLTDKPFFSHTFTFFFFLFFFIFYLFTFRERRKEGEREGENINVWLPLERPQPGTRPTTQACALTGNQTHDPVVCRQVLNPLSHTSQGTRSLFKQQISFPTHKRK